MPYLWGTSDTDPPGAGWQRFYVPTALIVQIPTSIVLVPSVAPVLVGQSAQLLAVELDQFGITMEDQPQFTWVSSSQSVASVGVTGLVSGLTSGTTSVTARANGLTSNPCVATVSTAAQVLTSILVTPTTASVAVGSMTTLSAVAKDQAGNPLATQPSFTWTSNTPSIATVGSTTGVVVGVAVGSAVVTALASGVTSNGCAVTVTPASPALFGYYVQ